MPGKDEAGLGWGVVHSFLDSGDLFSAGRWGDCQTKLASLRSRGFQGEGLSERRRVFEEFGGKISSGGLESLLESRGLGGT